jgi:tRNA threonylcarbamoyl adenosine modification protein (Sua5/YciO/YrdC/YwlC family)
VNLRDCRASSGRGEAIAEALRALAEGKCIVLPTDTVYGIGADARNPSAVQALLSAKGRSRSKPPPVLIGDFEQLADLTDTLNASATALAEALWPGALTLVLRAAPQLRWDLGDLVGTIAVRIPDHDFTRALLVESGPLAVSSANVSGQPPALSAKEAMAQLGANAAVYLDAGPARGGIPSTVVDATGPDLAILREGAIAREQIEGLAREAAPA